MTEKPAGSEAAKPPPPPPPPRRLEWTDQLCIVWFIIDGLTHLTIEAGYLWVAMGPTAAKSDTFMGFVWREYGRADHRCVTVPVPAGNARGSAADLHFARIFCPNR
jgi:hypothetical protein